MRFHLIDRVLEVKFNEYIIGVKCITLADDVFNEHFPGYPIFPGTLILEGMAQLSGSFFEMIMKESNMPIKRSVLTVVNHFKLKKPSYPGDRLIFRSDVKTFRPDEFGVCTSKALIDNEVYAEGELLFSFFDIKNETLDKSRQEIYEICMRDAKIIR